MAKPNQVEGTLRVPKAVRIDASPSRHVSRCGKVPDLNAPRLGDCTRETFNRVAMFFVFFVWPKPHGEEISEVSEALLHRSG